MSLNQGRTRDAPKKSNWAREPCSRFCIARREGGRESMQGGSDQMGHARICTYTCTCRGVRLAGRGQRMDSRSSHHEYIQYRFVCYRSTQPHTAREAASQAGQCGATRHGSAIEHRPCTCGGCCRARILGSFTWPASRASRPGRSSSQGRATVWSVPSLAP